MATFRIKRKQFGVINDTAGNVVEGAGKLLNNGVTKTAAGIAGALAAPKILGSIGTMIAGPVGGLIGGAAGLLGGGLITGLGAAKLAGTAGKTLQNIGQDIHS
jgi:hypothetical protein